MNTRVYVYSNHAFIRKALEQMILSQGLRISDEVMADVAVIDLNYGKEIYRNPTRLPSLALVRDKEEAAVCVMRMGYQGYIGPSDNAEVLLTAIKAIRNGEQWAERNVLAQALEKSNQQRAAGLTSDQFGLTPREQQVFSLLLEVLSNREIAEKLQITEKTVKGYVTTIFMKYGVRNRRELEAFARSKAVGTQKTVVHDA